MREAHFFRDTDASEYWEFSHATGGWRKCKIDKYVADDWLNDTCRYVEWAREDMATRRKDDYPPRVAYLT